MFALELHVREIEYCDLRAQEAERDGLLSAPAGQAEDLLAGHVGDDSAAVDEVRGVLAGEVEVGDGVHDVDTSQRVPAVAVDFDNIHGRWRLCMLVERELRTCAAGEVPYNCGSIITFMA